MVMNTFFFPVSVEHPGCLVLKGRQKSFLQEQECGIGWGRIKYMFLPVNGLNQGVMCNHVVWFPRWVWSWEGLLLVVVTEVSTTIVIKMNLRHLSLTANNIMAKLTNQFSRTGCSTFDWQQLLTWLWWWLPLRLSKCQSLLLTTGLLRIIVTWMIRRLDYIIIPSLPKKLCVLYLIFGFAFFL